MFVTNGKSCIYCEMAKLNIKKRKSYGFTEKKFGMIDSRGTQQMISITTLLLNLFFTAVHMDFIAHYDHTYSGSFAPEWHNIIHTPLSWQMHIIYKFIYYFA